MGLFAQIKEGRQEVKFFSPENDVTGRVKLLVPSVMTMPRSLCFKAPESLRPSPIIATFTLLLELTYVLHFLMWVVVKPHIYTAAQ